jgi:hypothetical protein
MCVRVCTEGSLSVRDVTRRYTSRWSEVTQRRMPEPDWWHQTLSVISRPTEAMLVRRRSPVCAVVCVCGGVRVRWCVSF